MTHQSVNQVFLWPLKITIQKPFFSSVVRAHRYAEKAKNVMFNPVGQIVGTMNSVRPVRDVIYQLVEEYLEATERLQRLTAD